MKYAKYLRTFILIVSITLISACGPEEIDPPPPPPDIDMLGEWMVLAKFSSGDVHSIPIEITSQSEGSFQGTGGGNNVSGSLGWGVDGFPRVNISIGSGDPIACATIFGTVYLDYTFEYDLQHGRIEIGMITDPQRRGTVRSYCLLTLGLEITANRI